MLEIPWEVLVIIGISSVIIRRNQVLSGFYADQALFLERKEGHYVYAYVAITTPTTCPIRISLQRESEPVTRPKSACLEVAFHYQDIWVQDVNVAEGSIRVVNEYFFQTFLMFPWIGNWWPIGIPIKKDTECTVKTAPDRQSP